jgi:S1-C subfamily serine protease
MVRRTGQQGVPVIAVGDQYIVGFDQPRIEQALAASRPARPRFGASIADVAAVRLREPSLPPSGAYIGRVGPDSPASRAGFMAGDVIVEVNGRPVSGAADLETALRASRTGEPVTLGYLRRGERRTAAANLS